MAEVAFYHLIAWPLERALPKLLERTVESGKRAVVIAGSDARVESLDMVLWTYEADSWLPHGTSRMGHPANQPVWLTMQDENPNGAQFLFLTEGMTSDRLAEYERCFDLFDGNDPQAVQAARERWTACKAAGHDLAYWRQTDQGRWERQA
ncbi:DNA polymerase III subunit chi [Magnetospira sp. QH-2]|uniref:DNA polymerase III subunit chi n=1 Tax=Magnetospira sp. (strain QH-2) TaxID=1288970 RepID=UPI0003E813FD|nr:DNA polymerase III subunit chi [Magnetospira sp. QH-2]CCQ72835.1 putative DNA polymerase III, chi subunit [Magnetospira sp. QH-2]